MHHAPLGIVMSGKLQKLPARPRREAKNFFCLSLRTFPRRRVFRAKKQSKAPQLKARKLRSRRLSDVAVLLRLTLHALRQGVECPGKARFVLVEALYGIMAKISIFYCRKLLSRGSFIGAMARCFHSSRHEMCFIRLLLNYPHG